MNFATKEDAWFQGRKFSPKVFPSTSTTSSTCHSILRHTWPLLLLVRPPIVLRRPVISIVNRYDTSSLHHGLRSKINLEFVGDIEPIHNFSHQLIRRATSPPVYPFSRYTSFEALRNSCEQNYHDYPLRSPLFVVPVNWHPTSGRFVADRRATESTRERESFRFLD